MARAEASSHAALGEASGQAPGTAPVPVLELRRVTKAFGASVANRAVDFSVARQTIHALVGENGAGKSTLMKIAYGQLRADSGELRVKGELLAKPTVGQLIRRGVGMVHQHFMLVPPLTVAENVVLGQETKRGPLLDLARAAGEIRALSDKFGLRVDPHARVEDLSVGEQQRVEILKVLWRGCDVLILDEPTAVLTPGEVTDLFAVLEGLVRDGRTVVLITHKLDEVLAVADHVTVMRRGEKVAELPAEGLTAEAIVTAMVGRSVQLQAERAPAKPGEVVLEVKRLSARGARGLLAVREVDLHVRAGEIVGIAGVEGNGQTELVEAIVGLRAASGGEVAIGGARVTAATVAAHYRAGLSHVPEDRHDRALVLDFSIAENLVLGQQRDFARSFDLLDHRRIADNAAALIEEYDIRPTDAGTPARGLSGGNQQKIVVARELARRGARLLVCAQPTRGVDIGAIESIHRRMVAARDRGLAVLLLSAELSELRALSDRLYVMYKGQLVRELGPGELGRPDALEVIGALMTGASAPAPAPQGAA